MNPDTLFQLSSTLALLGWVLLLIFHKTLWIGKVLIGTIITLFAILYTWLIASNLSSFQSDSFNSLDNIANLFHDRSALLAGWIHYLAFDLLTGVFIVTNARKHGIGFWPLLPCLFFTFMLGPFGLLLYLLLRWFQTRQYFADIE
ncbi:DUF4281 domain-containing protein [Flavihumibacter rivuli]|uniref:abscisic acid-deficient protein Aba4 family protein n=1 Tax=Flavihumibacter rivuli TaxID=2838156 RepID=UPI001BDED962|nr:abscisic acid-deficient protein Aba4 family protein [Flavihumibacter rivuli]ULQ57678.1 DUF4281 domain-containing protein [Flavihumibacter rivuli]